jgi:hypothetical protein
VVAMHACTQKTMSENQAMDVSIETTGYASLAAFVDRNLIAAVVAGAALSVTASASIAQVALKTYADEKGYISVRV